MNKMNGESMDLERENVDKLKDIFPEVFIEGKIDYEKLQLILGEDIEDSEERYSFNWHGKRDSIRLSQTPTTGTLRPDKENSKNWDETENLYIEGDNLEVLKLLQKSYHSKIKMIYIDPPYNTGKDFVYKDNYRDNMKNYLEFTEQVDEEGHRLSTNTDTSGRYHTDWLNMMYPRLRLARNLLTEDGVIFISIDDNEVYNLRKICDEIFGEDNFVANIVWRKKTGLSDVKGIATITEYVLVYIKNNIYIDMVFNMDYDSYDVNRYKLEDEYVKIRGKHYIDNLDRGSLGYVKSLDFGITAPDGNLVFPNGRTKQFNDGWRWTWGREKVDWGLKNGFLVFKKNKDTKCGWRVYRKNYLNVDNEGKIIKKGAPYKNLITNIINTKATVELNKLLEKGVFQYSKPVDIIKQYIKMNHGDNCIILDFFAGSSTTAHAVMDLNSEDGGNRKYIMVQLPEPTDETSEAYKAGYKTIADIGRERIRRAGEKILEDNKDKEGIEELDIGFKSFKLDTSNIKEWNPDYLEKELTMEDLVNNFLLDRGKEDILYEIILKYGIDLSTPIEEYNISDKTIYNVGLGSLYICLDNHIDNEVVEEILKLHEEYKMPNPIVVFKDIGFENDEIK